MKSLVDDGVLFTRSELSQRYPNHFSFLAPSQSSGYSPIDKSAQSVYGNGDETLAGMRGQADSLRSDVGKSMPSSSKKTRKPKSSSDEGRRSKSSDSASTPSKSKKSSDGKGTPKSSPSKSKKSKPSSDAPSTAVSLYEPEVKKKKKKKKPPEGGEADDKKRRSKSKSKSKSRDVPDVGLE